MGGFKRLRKVFNSGVTNALIASAFLIAAASSSSAQSREYRIGVLTPGGRLDAVVLGMKERLERWQTQEGKKINFITADTQGKVSVLDDQVKKLLENRLDLLFAVTTAHARAAKEATATLPIVFAWVGDPIGSGLAASYISSKNNLTGVSSFAGPILGKRLEILKEIAPRTKRVLVLVDPNDPASRIAFKHLEEAATKLRVNPVRREAATRAEVEKVMAAIGKESVDAIYFIPSDMIGAQRDLLFKKSKVDKLPLVAAEAGWVESGALLSYAADFRWVGEQASRLVVKVLNGEKPAAIPVETPDRFILSLNATTAHELGLKIPRSVLERIDRVFE